MQVDFMETGKSKGIKGLCKEVIIHSAEPPNPNSRLIFAFSLTAPVAGTPGKSSPAPSPPPAPLSLCSQHLSRGVLNAPLTQTEAEPGKSNCSQKMLRTLSPLLPPCFLPGKQEKRSQGAPVLHSCWSCDGRRLRVSSQKVPKSPLSIAFLCLNKIKSQAILVSAA